MPFQRRSARASSRPITTAGAAAAGILVVTSAFAQTPPASPAKPATCAEDTGLALPPGFCATVFADQLGFARHLAVAADGTVFVNTWSGRYYQNKPPPPGGMLVALKDTKGDGHADKVERFGASYADGDHGGTGIAVYKDAIYAEMNDRIIRYQRKPGEIAPSSQPE